MTIKRWFYLFWTTLLIGSFSALIAGWLLQLTDQQFQFPGYTAASLDWLSMWLGGATISLLSQMGFFAYLTLQYVALGFFRRKSTWNLVQWTFIIFACIDLVYLRAPGFSTMKQWIPYVLFPLLLLAISIIVAKWKVKLTNPKGFLPTLFFMVVVTAVESVPVMRVDQASSTFFVMVPLILSNIWQILILHRVVKPSSASTMQQKKS